MSVTANSKATLKATCHHCGDPCKPGVITSDEKDFCCQGCKTVFEILSNHQLEGYYQLEPSPGQSRKLEEKARYDFLENETIRKSLLEFASEQCEKVTFNIPAIHCSSCIWLLENLNRLDAGVIDVKVDFTNKKASVHYQPERLSLKQLAELLHRIGYAPQMSLDEDQRRKKKQSYDHRLVIKIGIAGFCFGNVMLLSFPDYLGLNGIEQTYQNFFRYLNALLAVPVVFYAGVDYFISAFKGLRQRYANIDVPIALGVFVLFLRSGYEVLAGIGPGYFDSLVGLIFFLLIGKWFQNKTYSSLSFDRDYKSYFPLAILKDVEGSLQPTPVAALNKGDEVAIRNNEIIPADAILIDEEAAIDYSFITGESEPVRQKKGDYIYAGGRLSGVVKRMVVQKEVSQSYLTRLWNDEAFSKEAQGRPMVDRLSKYFTLVIISVAILAGVAWQFINPDKAWLVFTAVLIVACPCALALATPFTTGNMMRVFGRNKFYLKNAAIVELFSEIDTLVFDKTGTITHTDQRSLIFSGVPLSAEGQRWVRSVAAGSTHPLSRMVCDFLKDAKPLTEPEAYREIQGKGIEATVSGVTIRLGSAELVGTGHEQHPTESRVYLKIGGENKGFFQVQSGYREGIEDCVNQLSDHYKLAVLSGDNASEERALRSFFPPSTLMRFNQSPEDKLNMIKKMQHDGRRVVMLGDGLNDAGALKQSDMGIAVTEDIGTFSPASDAILEAGTLSRLDDLLKLGKSGKRVIRASFTLSFLYNFAGISLAVAGVFSPLIAAVLMPLSSISIVIFTTLVVRVIAKKYRL